MYILTPYTDTSSDTAHKICSVLLEMVRSITLWKMGDSSLWMFLILKMCQADLFVALLAAMANYGTSHELQSVLLAPYSSSHKATWRI